MTISILLLEDDPKIASEIRQYFTARNNQCDIAYDGYYHQSDPGIIIQSDPPKLTTRLIA